MDEKKVTIHIDLADLILGLTGIPYNTERKMSIFNSCVNIPVKCLYNGDTYVVVCQTPNGLKINTKIEVYGECSSVAKILTKIFEPYYDPNITNVNRIDQ